MHALVIGAGAIGQVLGYHLALGGAQVSLLVRPTHVSPPGGRLEVARARLGGRLEAGFFSPSETLTSLDEVGARRWDQVWMCVPSTALSEAWVAAVAEATGTATLVLLPAGVETVTRARPPFERTVVGLLAIMSRQTEGGATYWSPPVAALTLEGPAARRDAACAALRRGRFPAVVGDAGRAGAFGSAFLIPHVAALEASGWSYARLSEGAGLAASVAASREASAVAAAHLKQRPPFWVWLMSRWTLRCGLALARRWLPFELEGFFRSHFTKMRRQSEAQLREYIELGERHGQPVDALKQLVAQVFGGGSPPAASRR